MKDDILAALGMALDADHAQAVLDHRKTKKCALTVFAAKLLAKQFALCPDPNAAAEEMILRGWAGFRADWLPNRAQQFTPSAVNRKPNAVDAMQQIFEERGWNNGPECVRSSDVDADGIPAERGKPQGVVIELRAGAYRRG